MPTVSRMNRAFKLYRQIKSEQSRLRERFGRLRGIAVSDNEHAKKWQALEWPREVIEAYLENRSPNYAFHPHLHAKGVQEMNESFSGWRD